jgi:hypothetical protein
MSNGGKFKLYTVLNGLIFPTPTQPRISFERAIYLCKDPPPIFLILNSPGASIIYVNNISAEYLVTFKEK